MERGRLAALSPGSGLRPGPAQGLGPGAGVGEGHGTTRPRSAGGGAHFAPRRSEIHGFPWK